MAGSLLPQPKQAFQDNAWNPGVGYKVYTYAAGTLTPKLTYQDSALSIANANPVIADARGEVVMYGSGPYRVILKDANDNTVWDRDNIEPPGSLASSLAAALVAALAADLAASGGAAMIGIAQTGKTVQSLFDDGDVRIGAGVVAFGSNANNLGKGVQVGGGDSSYGSDGTLLAPDGHAAWLRMQPSKNESPVELVMYPSAAQGQASSTIGTSTITRVSGTEFSAQWVGRKIYFGPAVYRVLTVPDSDHMTVSNVLGGTIPFASTFSETFHVAYFSGAGTCTLAAGVVTRTSGDPFIPFISSPYVFKLNGTAYTVSAFTDVNTQTISAPPADGTYDYTFETDINDQLSTLRVQKLYGSAEENLSIYANYSGYHLRSFYSGYGKLRPIFIGNSSFTNIAAYADGSTSIGAEQGGEGVRVLGSSGTPVNRFETQAAATGFAPTWRARGTDTNVGMGFDAQGSGSFTFTSNGLTKTEFQIFGVGGASWLAVQSDNFLQPSLSANGTAGDIDIKLAPKGNGRVWLGAHIVNADAPVNGYILVKDNAGNVRKLATIA